MADLAHVVGADLVVGPTGDLLLVDGLNETNQRVLHRLLTSPGTYIWQLIYGAGLPAMVGSIISKQHISAVIKSQMALEEAVSKNYEPIIDINVTIPGIVNASILYYQAESNQKSSINVSIGV